MLNKNLTFSVERRFNPFPSISSLKVIAIQMWVYLVFTPCICTVKEYKLKVKYLMYKNRLDSKGFLVS